MNDRKHRLSRPSKLVHPTKGAAHKMVWYGSRVVHKYFLACMECGTRRWVFRQQFLSNNLCLSCSARKTCLRGTKHHWYKRGWFRDGNGYIMVPIPPSHKFRCMVKAPGNAVYKHRLVMAEHLDRPLTSKEIVHHINGKKDDNSLGNLKLVSPGQHGFLHGSERREFNKVTQALLKLRTAHIAEQALL